MMTLFNPHNLVRWAADTTNGMSHSSIDTYLKQCEFADMSPEVVEKANQLTEDVTYERSYCRKLGIPYSDIRLKDEKVARVFAYLLAQVEPDFKLPSLEDNF